MERTFNATLAEWLDTLEFARLWSEVDECPLGVHDDVMHCMSKSIHNFLFTLEISNLYLSAVSCEPESNTFLHHVVGISGLEEV